jgi:hypothetical protein
LLQERCRAGVSVAALVSAVITLTVADAAAQSVSSLTKDQQRELNVFGIRAGLGLHIGPNDIKNVQTGRDLEQMIALGLNGSGHLCANVVHVSALKMAGKYEVTCVAYRGGSGQKTYIVDALKGLAYEE